ncbi:Glycolate oxidase iron-sulfur subunit [Nymphon striatum]|nr:Glycolate oxidase iron-sulfur subunit [Nymphon striatum]
MAGSWGTLGFLTEVSVKVLPRPETEITLSIGCKDDADAAVLMAAAMATTADITGASYVPVEVAAILYGRPVKEGTVLLRLEGLKETISVRRDRVLAALENGSKYEELNSKESKAIWTAIKNVEPFANKTLKPVWKISVPPMAGNKVVAEILKQVDGQAFYDWQGGLVWLQLDDENHAAANVVRHAILVNGGGICAFHRRKCEQSTVVSRQITMQTNFSPEQLKEPGVALSEKILRSCVHCGFCTATCPTYVTLGNELDSPRGRIYLIKDMLENDRPADEKTVSHIDRCLSCLACMTTCPSGVNYMHLVDNARVHIEKTYKRPFFNRLTRNVLAAVLPYPKRFKVALYTARFARPIAPLFKAIPALKSFGAMLELAPAKFAQDSEYAKPATHAPSQKKIGRVAILTGCAQPVLKPGINEATIELLKRIGVEVVVPKGEGCCGALVHHMGREEDALRDAKRNVDAWTVEIENGGLDAIIVTASGCGTTIKDYSHMLRLDPEYKVKAERVSALAKDVTEYLSSIELPEPTIRPNLVVAYHSACSMQHGQKITDAPKTLLKAAGFEVRNPSEGHLCCGSAGTYNIMQP